MSIIITKNETNTITTLTLPKLIVITIISLLPSAMMITDTFPWINNLGIPSANGANANLFVSSENSLFNNTISGPQVIEVVVNDLDINTTDQIKGEPDVTVNGKKLRMVQAVDGNWYGYFADHTMVITADATSITPGKGLDYGQICTVGQAQSLIGPTFTDSQGVGIPTTACVAGTGDEKLIHVVREEKVPNPGSGTVTPGQINIDTNFWPFVQLYNFSQGGNVTVTYNKGGSSQTVTFTFNTSDQFSQLTLDRNRYPQSAEVHATITDLWLNIDPTDEDSWTFGASSTNSTVFYQLFDENGLSDADGTTGAVDISSSLPSLMFGNNGGFTLTGSLTNVLTIRDNNDQKLPTDDRNALITSIGTDGGSLSPGSIPVTFTEQGGASGVFVNYDENDKSNILVKPTALRGNAAFATYNNVGKSILVGFDFATVDIQPTDAEWNSGEEIKVVIKDGDANKNSRVDEDLDLNDPNVSLIPSLKTGDPITLSRLSEAILDGHNITGPTQKFSDRAMLIASNNIIIENNDDLTLTFGNMGDIYYSSIPLNSPAFHGFALFNYDVRALKNPGNLENVTTVDITLPGIPTFTNQPLQGIILLPPSFGTLSSYTPLTVNFNINIGATDTITQGTTLPIVADIFGFGFSNDGREKSERYANQIIRFELEENGTNTSIFQGTVEYKMLNQLNILDSSTYTSLRTIADDPTFIVIDSLENEDSPRVNYNDLGADGVTTQVSDQQEIPTHSGTASLNGGIFNSGDTVTVNLKDSDLNVDSDVIDIYTVVSMHTDPNFDVVGKQIVANGGTSIALSTGDQLGRLLYVTFNNQKWIAPTVGSVCDTGLNNNGITNKGLSSSGFTLVETSPSSGEFVGDFQVPDKWCKSDVTSPESTTNLDTKVHYVDFRDALGEIIDEEYDNNKKYQVRLDSGTFTPTPGFDISGIIGTLSANETENFFFLQTTRFLNSVEIKDLKDNGITLVSFLDGFVYVASANSNDLAAYPFVNNDVFRSAIPIDPLSKLHTNVKSKNIPPWANLTGNNDEAVFIIYFHKQFPVNKMNQIIQSNGGIIVSAIEGSSAVYALMNFSQITDLSKHSAIKFIIYNEPPLEPEIYDAKKSVNIDPDYGIEGLTGEGVVALIFDANVILSENQNREIVTHNDLEGRIFPLNDETNDPDREHSFLVAGVLGGNGRIESLNTGIAPKVEILSYGSTASDDPSLWASNVTGIDELEDVFKKAHEWVVENNYDRIDLLNISMGNKVVERKDVECKNLGNYTATSRKLDEFVNGHSVNDGISKVIITKSAGNERGNLTMMECDQPNYPIENFGTVNSPATAKNPIVVGAIELQTMIVSSSSGFGPTDDGRIKPDLVAPGDHRVQRGITSTGVLNEYIEGHGTSISAPIVGGLVALMEEKWERINENTNEPYLNPHTAKAILIHTAEDLGNIGPDYKYGWGLINGKNAIELIANSKLINNVNTLDGLPVIISDSILQDETKTYSLPFSAINNLKLTLVWDDLPSDVSINNNSNLVNDLDLSVHYSGNTINPFRLDKSLANNTADTGVDKTNNVEMINTSIYGNNILVKVKASKIVQITDSQQQNFTLIVSGTPTDAPFTVPGVPTNLSAIISSPTQINLSWSAPTTGTPITSYKIEVKSGSDAYSTLANTSNTTYSHTGLSAGTYTYKVSAINAVGTGVASSERSATINTTFTVPGVPTNLSAIISSPTQINLSWSAPTTGTPITSYKIEVKSGSDAYSTLANTSNTTYSHTGLSAGTYTYKVSAINAVGTGVASSERSATINTTFTVPGGCLIATAVYGSEMAPQVQLLREIRDTKLMSTTSGASFMTGFNAFYYSFSPAVADLEREHPIFKEIVKIGITPMMISLSIMSVADSDAEVLTYGIGVILINIGMYFTVPILVLIRIKKHIQKQQMKNSL